MLEQSETRVLDCNKSLVLCNITGSRNLESNAAGVK